ncbi:hypothetical protein D3C87_1539720 [compost metagenome]
MPTYISRRSSSIFSSLMSSSSRAWGRMPSSTPTRNTCGYSRPFEAWSVESRTASGSSSRPSSMLISATVWVSSSRFLPSSPKPSALSKPVASPSPASASGRVPLRLSQSRNSSVLVQRDWAWRSSKVSYKYDS